MKKLIISTFLAGLTFSGCQTNAVTGKHSLSLIPESEMVSMSLTEYDKFLADHPPLPDYDPRVTLVRTCGTKIQKAVEQFYAQKNASKEISSFQWTFNVVDENTVNSWCMPGGKVVVYTAYCQLHRMSQVLPLLWDTRSRMLLHGTATNA